MLVDTFTRISLNNECILQSCRDMHLSICTCICISIHIRLSEPSHTLQTLKKLFLRGAFILRSSLQLKDSHVFLCFFFNLKICVVEDVHACNECLKRDKLVTRYITALSYPLQMVIFTYHCKQVLVGVCLIRMSGKIKVVGNMGPRLLGHRRNRRDCLCLQAKLLIY